MPMRSALGDLSWCGYFPLRPVPVLVRKDASWFTWPATTSSNQYATRILAAKRAFEGHPSRFLKNSGSTSSGRRQSLTPATRNACDRLAALPSLSCPESLDPGKRRGRPPSRRSFGRARRCAAVAGEANAVRREHAAVRGSGARTHGISQRHARRATAHGARPRGGDRRR